ncbi:MAG: C40 family peptidase [Oxalobacter sp.]|nr:C40 family peptidase [Oxalobacter sp.]
MTSDVVSKPHHPHGYTPRATDIAMTAMSLIGTPYRYGGNSPLTGLDCSGFVKYVYKETLDTNLPRTAAEMSRVGQPVSQNDLQPGDLVFYNTMRRSNSHVGIYLGDGRFIHSPRTGQRVRINSMDESYWRGRFNGARRIIGGQGIDRAKALQQYSREADTSPDTYNYDDSSDDPGEPPRERSVSRRHTERSLADTQKPADDVVVQESVVQEPSYSGDQEVRHERRSRHRGVRHQDRAPRHHDAAKETVRDNSSRRHKAAKHSGKEENRRHKETRHDNADRDHKPTRNAHHRGNDRDLAARRVKDSRHQEAKADKRDIRNPRRERTSDRHHTEKAKAVKSIERKAAPKEKAKRRR